VLELWDAPARSEEPPMFGWLSTNLPPYPQTVNLKTSVHLRNDGLRPFIELEPTDHPLAIEQRDGNRDVLQRWVDRWTPGAEAAASGLSQLFERLSSGGRSADTVLSAANSARRRVLSEAGL